MKKFILLLLISSVFRISFSQDLIFSGRKNGLINDKIDFSRKSAFKSLLPQDDFGMGSAALIFMCVINPLLIYEDQKVSFGLTKEASLAFPFFSGKSFGTIGRIGVEYSYIFRDDRNHHLRTFYSTDFVIESGDYAAITAGLGFGYFTDFRKNGLFPQVSFNMLVPVTENFAVSPYAKLRHTFMLEKSQPDNTDLSVGLGFNCFLF